jgi:hypothetical protein
MVRHVEQNLEAEVNDTTANNKNRKGELERTSQGLKKVHVRLYDSQHVELERGTDLIMGDLRGSAFLCLFLVDIGQNTRLLGRRCRRDLIVDHNFLLADEDLYTKHRRAREWRGAKG